MSKRLAGMVRRSVVVGGRPRVKVGVLMQVKGCYLLLLCFGAGRCMFLCGFFLAEST